MLEIIDFYLRKLEKSWLAKEYEFGFFDEVKKINDMDYQIFKPSEDPES